MAIGITIGIKGKILNAKSVYDIKNIEVIFESDGVKYEVSDLVLSLSGFHQNEYRMYLNGKCTHDNVAYRQVSLRIHFFQKFPITYHISIEDFNNQEAYLFLA